MAAKRRSILGRLSWGVLDQGVSSLQNFVLGIFVARSLGLVALGALGLAFVAYAVVLSGHRGLSTDPLAVRFSGDRNQRWQRGASVATGTALVLGSFAGVVCAAIGVVSWSLLDHPEVGAAMVALGVTLPGLTLQDSWRYAFFSSGQGAKAFTNDVVWSALMVAALVALQVLDVAGVGWCLLAFGGTAYLAALLGAVQAGFAPDPRRVRSWLSHQGDLGGRFLLENIALGVGGQVRPAVVAAADSVRAAGGVRGAEMLMGPVATMLMGVAQVAVPETVRGLARGRAPFRRLCVLVSLTLAGAAGAWAVVVLVVFPLGVGRFLLGDAWDEAHALFPAVALSAAAGCLPVGPSAGLRALERADRTLRCQVVSTALFVALAVAGAGFAGAAGAVWGTATASLLAAGFWWAAFLKAEAHHFAAGLDVQSFPASAGELVAAAPVDGVVAGRQHG